MRSAHTQGGLALLELAVAAALAAMAAVWAANRLVQDAQDAAARGAGVWLGEIQRGLDQLLHRHFDTLAAGLAPRDERGRALFRDAWRPTLPELQAAGLLARSLPRRSPLGTGVIMLVRRDPHCPRAGCRLDALAWLDRPLLDGHGQVDLMRMAPLVAATAGRGGFAVAGGVRGAAFRFANPPWPDVARLPAGTPLAWAGLAAGKASPAFGGAYSVNSHVGCRSYSGHTSRNPLTGQCSCPPGYASVIMAQATDRVDGAPGFTSFVCVRPGKE